MAEDNKPINQVPVKPAGSVLGDSNSASANTAKQVVPTSPAFSTQSGQTPAPATVPVKKSSSPWDEDIDLPEETDKKKPTIIGTLDPRDSVGGQKAFAIPPDMDEKVGKKIEASEVLEKNKVQAIPAPLIKPSDSSPINSQVDPINKAVSTSDKNVNAQDKNNDIASKEVGKPEPKILPTPEIATTGKLEPKVLPTPEIATNSSKSLSGDMVSPVAPEKNTSTLPPVAPVVAPAPATSVVTPDVFDDFDWFGTGTTTNASAIKQTTAPKPTPPTTQKIPPQNIPPAKQIDIKKPTPASQTVAQSVPINTAQSSNIPLKPALPSSADLGTNVDIAKPLNEIPKPEASEVVASPTLANELPEPKKRRFSLPSFNLKIVALFFGAIIFIFGLLIGLTEFGILGIGFEKVYGSIGMEQAWGGLSKNPNKALARSFTVMKNHPNFKVRGQLNLNVDSSIKSEITSPLVPTIEGETTGIKIVNSTLEFKNNENISEAVFLISSETGENKITLLNKNDQIFVSGNENVSYKANTDGSKWSAYTIGSLKDKSVQKDFFGLVSGQGLSVEGSRTGSEKINNELSYKYSLSTIEIGDALSGLGITSDMIQTASGDVWLGVKSKFIRRLALKINTPTSSSVSQINLDINFYDYDVANEISEVDSANIVEEKTILTGDLKRKSDVAEIVSALKKYKDANGSYPNSQNLLVPLNVSGNIIENALVPAYLSALPTDENNLFGWYYAYKSNGTTCSVSSRLEKTDDTEGQNVNNLILYIKYSTDSSVSTSSTSTTGSQSGQTSSSASSTNTNPTSTPATITQSSATGDAKRKEEVDDILLALEIYKDDNGSFPSSSDQWISLSESGNVVQKNLVPDYLLQIPSDVNASQGWVYSYKSNGITCSVSSRLENTDDPEGQNVNNSILYIQSSSG